MKVNTEIEQYLVTLILFFYDMCQMLKRKRGGAADPSARPGHAGEPEEAVDWPGWQLPHLSAVAVSRAER